MESHKTSLFSGLKSYRCDRQEKWSASRIFLSNDHFKVYIFSFPLNRIFAGWGGMAWLLTPTWESPKVCGVGKLKVRIGGPALVIYVSLHSQCFALKKLLDQFH